MFALMGVGCSCLLFVVCLLLLSVVYYMFVVVFPFDVPRRAWNVRFLKCMLVMLFSLMLLVVLIPLSVSCVWYGFVYKFTWYWFTGLTYDCY